MSQIDEILPLRLQALARFAEYRLDGPGVKAVRRELALHLEQASSIEVLRRGSEVTAAMALGSPRPSMLGLSSALCVADFSGIDDDICAWVQSVFASWSELMDEGFVFILKPHYRPLLPTLFGCQLRVQALVLHGEPAAALAALGKPPGATQIGRRWGLAIEPLCAEEQVERLVELRRRYFRDNPHNSPLSDARTIDSEHQALIDSYVRDSLLAAVRAAPPVTQYVVLRAGEVVGGFGINLSDGDPILGRCAGMEIFLDQSAHGRGVGTLIYQLALAQMHELGVRVFRGTTANRGVIHLARKMRRPLRGWKLVPGSCEVLPAHFDYPLRDWPRAE